MKIDGSVEKYFNFMLSPPPNMWYNSEVGATVLVSTTRKVIDYIFRDYNRLFF